MKNAAQTVGLISDTHGLLRRSAMDALLGVDRILHAGDIDSPGVLENLRRIAPVHAVLGNMDRKDLFTGLPRFDIVTVEQIAVGIIHDRQELDLNASAAGLSAVIHGHSHRPSIEERDGVLFINPGSAGPKRFQLPVSIGLLHISGSTLTPEIIELNESSGPVSATVE
jgi:putative phosphoesterase